MQSTLNYARVLVVVVDRSIDHIASNTVHASKPVHNEIGDRQKEGGLQTELDHGRSERVLAGSRHHRHHVLGLGDEVLEGLGGDGVIHHVVDLVDETDGDGGLHDLRGIGLGQRVVHSNEEGKCPHDELARDGEPEHDARDEGALHLLDDQWLLRNVLEIAAGACTGVRSGKE